MEDANVLARPLSSNGTKDAGTTGLVAAADVVVGAGSATKRVVIVGVVAETVTGGIDNGDVDGSRDETEALSDNAETGLAVGEALSVDGEDHRDLIVICCCC